MYTGSRKSFLIWRKTEEESRCGHPGQKVGVRTGNGIKLFLVSSPPGVRGGSIVAFMMDSPLTTAGNDGIVLSLSITIEGFNPRSSGIPGSPRGNFFPQSSVFDPAS